MEPMILTHSFTIGGYDVTVTIEFFPHIVVLEDSSPELTDDAFESVDISLICEIANSWRFILFYLTLTLGCFLQKHLTARSFSAETFYCWTISYNINPC